MGKVAMLVVGSALLILGIMLASHNHEFILTTLSTGRKVGDGGVTVAGRKGTSAEVKAVASRQGKLAEMSDTDLPKFMRRLAADSQVQRLMPDGGGNVMSVPVPLESGEAVIFIHRISGLPPKRPQVYAPHLRVNAAYPSGKVISVEAVTPSPPGILTAEDESPGEAAKPELSSDEFALLREEFERLYSAAINAYLTEQSPNPDRCRRLLELLPTATRVQLLPLLRRANPHFFDFIDRCAKSSNEAGATIGVGKPAQELADVLARLRALPVFNKESIETVLDVKFLPAANANRYHNFYKAAFPPAGLFTSVEFGEPSVGATSDEQRLTLSVNPESHITRRDISEQFGAGVIFDIVPDAQPDGLVTYVYEVTKGRMLFTFNHRTYQLISTGLVRSKADKGDDR